MKAIVVREYGGPEVLKLEDVPKPVPAAGEVLVKVAAASINPFDFKRRNGSVRAYAPITFPGILGIDVSGTVEAPGPGVKNFSVGDRVFAMADKTHAEFCVVKAEILAKIPEGLDLIEAAALPLVLITGSQLANGTEVGPGQTVLVTGAGGSVGRSAAFTAKQKGARVIAGVRKNRLEEARTIGADDVVALDDPPHVDQLPKLDAVADAVGGPISNTLIAKVKSGGTYASVVGGPANASSYPEVKVVPVYAQPDSKVLYSLAQAVRDGKLTIPISLRLPLKDAGRGHAAVEKGGIGKVLLTVE
jgi:NADPH:quinone reductase-like Zn-dependent oxidoreductase